MGEEDGEEGSGEEREVQKPDISHAKRAHPHHQAAFASLTDTPAAPFDRWRQGGSQVKGACSRVTQPESGEGDSTQAF